MCRPAGRERARVFPEPPPPADGRRHCHQQRYRRTQSPDGVSRAPLLALLLPLVRSSSRSNPTHGWSRKGGPFCPSVIKTRKEDAAETRGPDLFLFSENCARASTTRLKTQLRWPATYVVKRCQRQSTGKEKSRKRGSSQTEILQAIREGERSAQIAMSRPRLKPTQGIRPH